MRTIHGITYIVIGVCLLLLFTIGSVIRETNKDGWDYNYSECGHNIKWYFLGILSWICCFYSLKFSCVTGMIYEIGFLLFNIIIASVVGLSLGLRL
jgi:hypothetical protein